MKIIIPENISDITLSQYQKYTKLLERTDLDAYNFNKRKIEIFCNIPFRDIDNIQHSDIEEILTCIDNALNQDAEFKNIFKIGSVEFGFIPNLDKITGAEFIDLSNYGTDPATLHNLMAVLFRPISQKDIFGNYSIISYQGTEEFAEIMKQTPMNIVNGALVFFCNLANELQNHIQKFTEEEQKRAKQHPTTSKSGDGMQQFMI